MAMHASVAMSKAVQHARGMRGTRLATALQLEPIFTFATASLIADEMALSAWE